MKQTITIVGLGPGSLDLLTRKAVQILEQSRAVFVLSEEHPVVQSLKEQAKIVVLGDGASRPESVAYKLLSRRSASVVYAAPGNPLEDDAVARCIVEQAASSAWSIQVVPGVSYLDVALEALRLTHHTPGLQVVDASELVRQTATETKEAVDVFAGVYRTLDPTRPLIVQDVATVHDLEDARRALALLYPDDQPVTLVSISMENGTISIEEVTLSTLTQVEADGQRLCLYLKPLDRLSDLAAFDTLRYIVARLRAPNGCPWDREQTHESMKKHLLEETYEAVSALDQGNLQQFASELGDVLLQVVMHSQLGREAGKFELEDVLRAVNAKLIRRHPHVFGNVEVSSSADVLRNWERIKRSEGEGAVSPFFGIPEAAPALMRADAVQSRATRYGWIPPAIEPGLKVIEQPGLGEEEFERYLGDTLFGLVSLARQHHVDPEEALRLTTNRFCAALDQVLAECQVEGKPFETLELEERRRRLADAMVRV
jgi:tetrapyrrole methylase family protein/MazG family protein